MAAAGLAMIIAIALISPPDSRRPPMAALSSERTDPGDLRALYIAPPGSWPPAQVDPGIAFRELGTPPFEAAPEAGKAALGRDLFHDPALSAQGDMACASCHQAHSYSDGRPAPPNGLRNTTALHTASLRTVWGWDGRHATLGEALLGPLTDRAEMGNPDLASAIARLRPEYSPRFRTLYGPGRADDGEAEDDALTIDRLADALEAFVAGLDAPTRFDRFVAGDGAALSDEEILGLHLFRTRAGCVNCHHGPLLSDEGFHNLGLSAFGELSEDLGRYRVTGRPEDAGRFRTPSLRHVGQTAPYMHTGHFRTLEGVVRFYARGGGEVWARNAAEAAWPLYRDAARISPHVRLLDLDDAEIRAIAAFLDAL